MLGASALRTLDTPDRLAYRRRLAPSAAYAWVAQLVEQRIENPRVGGSNPPPGTIAFLIPDKTVLNRFSLAGDRARRHHENVAFGNDFAVATR